MSNEKPAYIPTPPKSIGLSRRLVVAIIIFFLSVMVLFLVFLKRYSTNAITHQSSSIEAPINQEDSSAQIAKIESEEHHPLLVSADNKTKSMVRASATNAGAKAQSGIKNKAEFREGSNASISVYHNPASRLYTSNSRKTPVSNSRIGAMNALSRINRGRLDPYQVQNMQSEKMTFLKESNKKSEDYIKSTLHKPLSPFELKAGTIIPATLVTGINSTLPGTIIAKVRRDVFDSVSGNYLLIPQGTTLLGRYDSQVAYGQSRVLIVWSRLIFPNGASFDLQGMPGVDLSGMAGLHDKVNHHYFRVFGNALLLSLFGSVGQLSQPRNNTNQLSAQQVLYAAVGQQMSQTAIQLMERNMNIQPTIMIRAGVNFNVILTQDIVISCF